MSLKPIGNSTVTFSDLPKDEAEAWAAKTPHHSTVTFGGQLTYPMYHQIPTTYVHMLDDKTIPLEMQKGMVEAANKDKEGRITTYSMNGGHFPFISRPEELAKVVIKAAEATA
jgi:pimeloyl-ACP methyl ester carboxylesterase